MARISQHDLAVRRSGVALLIVIAMLALFATVGLSFVFYAEAEATASRLYRQAQTTGDVIDINAETLANFALGQLIFEADPVKNPDSKLKGFGLARSIYGPIGGTVPYNGLGRPHPDSTSKIDTLTPFDGVNVPYTFPDANNPFLATIDIDGVIKKRSFELNGSTLRPATLQATGLPAGEADVRNVDSANGVTGGFINDSYWMDLGYGVQVSKSGTRYKPLFAFTVVDLDGRLNLGVAGNYLADYATAGAVTSRCGIGAWELNPAKILTVDSAEIAKLFRGSSSPPSRFGGGATDAPDKTVTFPQSKFYSRVDYTGTAAGRPAKAGNLATDKFSQFPLYGGWADLPGGSPHAAGFDWFHSRTPSGAAGDSRLNISNVEALLRWRDRGSPALTSDLFRLLPKNLDTQNATSKQIFNMVTTYSMSLDTAHLAPFFVNDGNSKYELTTGTYPKINVLTQASTTGAGKGELSASFHSRTAGELRRINLNRGFTSMQDRLTMCQEIFDRLVRVTGALPPSANPPFSPPTPTDPQYKATRWLAQLAANIVDFIDDDETMTVFNWNPKTNPATIDAADFVNGVEMNRLLINEVYVSFDNDQVNDPGCMATPPNAAKYRVNAWAELYNPMSNAATNGGLATLANGNQPCYRILLAKDATGINDSPTGLPVNLLYDNNDPNLGVMSWPAAKSTVPPGDRSAGGAGYYLVGPDDSTLFADRKPTWTGITWDHSSTGMSSKLIDFQAGFAVYNPTLVLQRLADSSRAEQPDPTQPNYNPFVTVDYFANTTAANSIKYNGPALQTPSAFGALKAVGRKQPLRGGVATDIAVQIGGKVATGPEPQHTFGKANNPINFGSLFWSHYHLDRPLISSAEVMHASAVPPWQITQTPIVNPFSTANAYNDANSLLYRFLETVTVGDRGYNSRLAAANPSGIAGAGLPAIHVPGRINLNTAPDKKLIQALFDRQSNSYFLDADVDTFWNELTAARPIAGFSDFNVASDGTVTMQKTLFNNLFQKLTAVSTGVHEYEKAEGIRKVMNNITFTSNVFAVWITAGFFEVDANNNPTREIGVAEGTNIRHRMFAVIDRSQLVVPDQQLTTLTAAVSKSPTASSASLAAASGTLTAGGTSVKVELPNWTIKSGMTLTLDKGQPTEETVMVMNVTGTTINTGGFAQDHAAGATVHLGGIRGPQIPYTGVVLGNPGPQPNFNLNDYNYVVPFYTIIE